jgi:plasmid stabilization system protein ParE
MLADHPRLGRVRDEDFGHGRRSLPIGDYIIVYSVAGADARIPRVVLGRRDIAAMFGG